MEGWVVVHHELNGQVGGGIEVDDFVVEFTAFEFQHFNGLEVLSVDKFGVFSLDLTDDVFEIGVGINC